MYWYNPRDDYFHHELGRSTPLQELGGLETEVVISHQRFRELLKIKKSLQRKIHVQTGRAKQILYRTVEKIDVIIQASSFYETYIAQMTQKKYVA